MEIENTENNKNFKKADQKQKVGVLLIHGFTASPQQFRGLKEYLEEKGFLVSCPVVAGHGTTPEDLLKTTPKEWKDSIMNSYVDLKEKTDKIFVIGNSFGSNLGFWLVKELNNNVAGIIALSAPIFLKYQKLLIARLYTYGYLLKYYKKPKRLYRNYFAYFRSLVHKKDEKVKDTEFLGKSEYDVIPIKSLKHFFKFIKHETIPNLKHIKAPILVAHSMGDPVVKPTSAKFIFENVGSQHKKIFWLPCNKHVIMHDPKSQRLYEEIYNFIKNVSQI